MVIEALSPTEEISREATVAEVNAALESIHKETTNEEAEEKGILLFKEEKSPIERSANEIYDGLMLTVSEVGDKAAEKALDPGNTEADKYKTVLEGLVSVAKVTRAFADDKILFSRDVNFEREREREGDKVYAYKASGLEIGGRNCDVTLRIRPKSFLRVSGLGRRLETAGSRDQRMNFRITPHRLRTTLAEIRIDPAEKITYDIVVPGVETAHLEGSQTEGHHFVSGFDYRCPRTSFSQVLEAINSKVKVKNS